MVDLLPCPFCGARPRRKRDISGMATISRFIMRIFCSNCPAIIIGKGHFRYVAEAVAEKAWNRRASHD